MAIIIIGDLHLKRKEPYQDAYRYFLQWLYTTYNDNEMIFLGDIFDVSAPHWDCYNDFKQFLSNRNNKTYIIVGNHDGSYQKGISVSSFNFMENVEVFIEPIEIEIERFQCLMLPFIYNNMKEQYENMKGEYDFIFTHFENSDTAFGEGVDPEYLKGIFIHGHQHIQSSYKKYEQEHIVVGCPYSTRHLEHKQEHRILKINDDKSIESISVPQYFTFRDIEYGDEIKEEWKNDIINIKNAPSIGSVHDKYKGFNIRDTGITLKEFDESDVVFEFKEDALQSYFQEFSKENDIQDEHIKTILEYMDETF